jgi:hypothetical protein
MRHRLKQIRNEGLLESFRILFWWKLWMPRVERSHRKRCQGIEAHLRLNPMDEWSPTDQQIHWYSPHFYQSADQQKSIAEVMTATRKQGVSDCLNRCSAILDGDFSWLIAGWTTTSQMPVWDSLIDKPGHWPRLPAEEIDYNTDERPGDIRRIWELNRHQYFFILGRGWRLSKDPTISACFASHLESWIDTNPLGIGANWTQAQEVALRGISWCWAWHFFHDAPDFTPELREKFLKALGRHLRYIESHICAFKRHTHNHLISELVGLYIITRFFPFLPEASRLEQWSKKLIIREVAKQIYPDGMAGELSSNYMHFVLDSLIAVVAADPEGWEGSSTWQRLAKMGTASSKLLRPDGSLPAIGDNDSGRGWILSEDLADRSAYSQLPGILGKGKIAPWAKESVSQEWLWLFGSNHPPFKIDEFTPSHFFEEGGIWTWRSSAQKDATAVLFRGGAVKRRHGVSQSHHHADSLSFELTWKGKPVIVDPGTYAYSLENDLRSHFRSAHAHSTLCVEGIELCSFKDKRFGVWNLPDSTIVADDRATQENSIHMSLQYDRVCHRRKLTATDQCITILDQVERPTHFPASLGFCLAPGISAKPFRQGWILPELNLKIEIHTKSGCDFTLREEKAWVSHRYGQKEPCTGLRVDLPNLPVCELQVRISGDVQP